MLTTLSVPLAQKMIKLPSNNSLKMIRENFSSIEPPISQLKNPIFSQEETSSEL